MPESNATTRTHADRSWRTAGETASAWWDQITVPPRSAVTHNMQADVCVVGLGGSGLAAVLAAQSLGARTVGLDAGRIAGAAAGRNGGLLLGGLAPFHHDAATAWGAEAATALYRHTLQALDAAQREADPHVRWTGSLRIAADDVERNDCARQYERMKADGLPVEWYTGPQGDGLRFPCDGAFHPVRRALARAAHAESQGAVLFEHSSVHTIEPGTVHLANGVRVNANTIIVCADGALGALLPEAQPHVQQVRLQMLATAPATDVQIPYPVYARYGYDYWQQLPDGRVMLGGGRDHSRDTEFTASTEPGAAVQEFLEQRLRSAVGTHAPITHRWAATVTYTTDGLPIARSFGHGIWGAGGYCGTGNVVGTLCGRGMVRRALGQPDAFLDAVDAARGEWKRRHSETTRSHP